MMFTGPRTTNSYPYRTNHIPSTHYCHPNWEPVPMQAKENSTAPLMHEPWPCYHGCQVPMACPNCLNHGQCPNPYYIRPHCQQFASPPPHFYGGYYPPYPQPCQVGYVPPPHYSMQLPRYEYDKNVPSGFHCCGCPNHNLKEEKSVKIEEHEPDVETKKSSGCLVPSGANNFSYPVLWIPSEYGVNKEKFRSTDKEVDDKHGKQVSPCVTRPQVVQVKKPQEFPTVVQHQQDSQPAEQDSTNNGWFPLDMDSLRKLIESGVGAKTRGEERRNVDEGSRKDVENKNQHKQFPYNIIWLPHDGQGEKEERIASTEPVEKASAISKAVPNKSDHPDHEMEKMRTEESGGYSKTVPVKKLQECAPKPSGESKEQKEAKQSGGNVKTIPVKQWEEFVSEPTVESKELKGDKEAKGKADDERGRKSVQSSPTKKSKLPPICLRVDPPKKRNGSGNGSSRSPSPPGDKKRQLSDDYKTSAKSEAMQPSKKDIKVEAKDDSPIYNKIEVLHVPQNEKKESVSDKSTDSSKEEAVHMLNGNSDVIAKDDRVQNEDGQGDTEKGRGTRKPTKKSLSEIDAALIIQSIYRGYEVRKTEPLKKLRQIAKIGDEVHKVRNHIEDIVSIGGNSIDRERAAIGETIMKLLLKLDTIQGLLPSIRDFRKCVANELIVLQEKLDSITCRNAAPQETQIEEQAQHSYMDKGHKDHVDIRNESSSTDSCHSCQVVESIQVNSESANEFSKDSIQGEGSEYNASTSDESSEKSVQDEGSQTAEQVSILSESFHEVDMNVNETQEELAYGMNQVPSGQPPMLEDVVCDSENKETLEAAPVSTSPINVDLESGSLDEVTVSPAGGCPELEVVGSDSNVGEKHPGYVCNESVADDATSNGITLRNEEEEEYLLAELPRGVLDYDEMKKETPENEGDMESMLRELPIQVVADDEANINILENADIESQDKEKPENAAGSTFSRIAALGDITHVENRDVDVNLLVVEEQPAEGSSSEVLKHSSKVEQPSENRESKPELRVTESLARVDHEPPSINSSIDIDVPIVEQDADEGVVPRDEGLVMCHIASRLNEETKATQSPEIDYGQETYCGHENGLTNGQSVGAETVEQESFGKHSESEMQQTKDEDEISELSSESQDLVAETKNEEVDEKIVEENERMKEMLDKLVAYGKQQQDLISSLSSKVEDLEKRLARRKEAKEAKRKRSKVKVLKSRCGKSGYGLLKERAMDVAS